MIHLYINVTVIISVEHLTVSKLFAHFICWQIINIYWIIQVTGNLNRQQTFTCAYVTYTYCNYR